MQVMQGTADIETLYVDDDQNDDTCMDSVAQVAMDQMLRSASDIRVEPSVDSPQHVPSSPSDTGRLQAASTHVFEAHVCVGEIPHR